MVKDTLTQVKKYISLKGFSYKDDLVDNLYLSLKSKPFVIFAGTSGTGKTKLVKLFVILTMFHITMFIKLID